MNLMLHIILQIALCVTLYITDSFGVKSVFGNGSRIFACEQFEFKQFFKFLLFLELSLGLCIYFIQWTWIFTT